MVLEVSLYVDDVVMKGELSIFLWKKSEVAKKQVWCKIVLHNTVARSHTDF